MFDEVTKREAGRNAARRAGFLFGSTAFQVALVAAIVAASAALRTRAVDEPRVEVRFVRPAAPRLAPAAPSAAPPAVKRPAPERKPAANRSRPPAPQALVQPREVQPEMKVDPDEPREPPPDDGNGQSEVGGVVGGTAGGVVGGVAGGTTAEAPAPAVEDAPVYARAGFKKPQVAERGCVERNLRLSEDLVDRLPGGTLTVKFAVRPDGTTSHFQAMRSGVPERITGAIWAAIQRCRWIPGEDAQGRPTAIFVIMPLRFQLD